MEQYTERLHQLGDEGHDEELNYIKQILASPIFYDFVRDSSQFSQEETTIFSEVASDLLSGMQEVADNDQLSPTEKRKQKLQRKRSLKALRNVVTPKNSPRIATKRAHGSSAGADGKKGTHDGASAGSPSSDRSLSLGAKHQTSSHSIANGRRIPNQTPLSGRASEHVYTPSSLSNGGIEFEAPPTTASGSLMFDSPSKDLSNSASTLIERSTSPSSSDGTLNKQSAENLLMNGGVLLTGSDTPYMLGNGTGPGSIPPIGMDWDHPSPTKQLLPASLHDSGGPPLKLTLPPVPHRQPPSYQRHMQSQQQVHTHQNHNLPPHHRIVTSPQIEGAGRPPPPPYGQNNSSGGTNNLQAQRRSKSFDRLLESSPSEGSLPVHFPPPSVQSPPQQDMNIADSAHFGTSSSHYGNPVVRPMTDGVATKNFLTATDRRRTTLTVRLEKGEKGLGFRVKGLRNEQYGDLFVQDLQPGGVAER